MRIRCFVIMPMVEIKARAPDGTQSIQRAVALLREIAVRAPDGGWRLSELAGRCGIDRTTAHRILKCLVAEGMVEKYGERYRLGLLVFEMGLGARPPIDLRPLCHEALSRIAGVSGDTAFLNVRSGFDSVCVDRREGAYPVKALTVEIGARRPLAASAGGLAMLLALPDEAQREIIRENAQRLIVTTGLTAAKLETMLKESRAAGYGLNQRRVIPGVVAVGMAICDSNGAPLGALSVAAISERLDTRRRLEIVALLRDQVARVELKLGAHRDQ